MKSSTAGCRRRNPLSARLLITIFLPVTTAFFTNTAQLAAQTLFTYGKQSVSKEEFLRAFNKNNSDTSGAPISYADYLELYSRFKLKVQAALDAGLDTTTQQQSEIESFRYQLADNFVKDDASINLLVNEAFERSLKDINISYIFAPVYSPDTAEIKKAQNKINEAYKRLQAGEPWEKVSQSYDQGNPGFITVFVLPYAIENAAYTTAEGRYSEPFRASQGFFIVRNNKERAAVGKVRVAQILLAFHPTMNDSARHQLREFTDSLHNDLLEGGTFADSAKKYSNDNLTYQNGGEMPAFGLGEYDTAFTNAAFALQKDGDISSPVATSFGFHILQRIQRIDVIDDRQNTANLDMLKEKVLQSDRMLTAQAALIESIKKKIARDASSADLQSDSAVLAYYRKNLDRYNPGFAEQMKEFQEGNLLFGIMQQKVWDAAAADSVGLLNYYNTHKEKYNWESSADAIIVTAASGIAVDSIQAAIRKNPASWRTIVEQSNGGIQADSARFELAQIPVVDRTNFTEGLITAPVANDQDNSKTFAYVVKLHPETSPKDFEDAKGTVINDYQQYIEEKWIAELKKKYPVKVNKKVFNSLGRKS